MSTKVIFEYKSLDLGSLLGLFFPKKMGPYKVLISASKGPFQELAALPMQICQAATQHILQLLLPSQASIA